MILLLGIYLGNVRGCVPVFVNERDECESNHLQGP